MTGANGLWHFVFRALLPALGAWQTPALMAGVVLLIWVLLPLRNRGVRRHDRCAQCGYSVEGLTQPACPECGNDLAARGVYLSNQPRMRAWYGRLSTWTLVWLALAVLFGGGPWTQHIPQPYGVLRSWSFDAARPDGVVIQRISMRLGGSAIRWPWQRSVTAQTTQIIIDAADLVPQSGGTITIAYLYQSEPDAEVMHLSPGFPGGPTVGRGPITEQMIVDHLLAPNVADDGEIARRIVATIQAHPTVTGRISTRQPKNWLALSAGVARATSHDFIAALVRWLCLMTWLIGVTIFYRRWRRTGRVDWIAED